MSTMYS